MLGVFIVLVGILAIPQGVFAESEKNDDLISMQELSENIGEDLARLNAMHGGIVHDSGAPVSEFAVASPSDDEEDDFILYPNEASV